jgi:putative ABC transport system permease protein
VRLALALALRDLLHQRVLFLCSALGLAAVLAPLLILGGLREGVVAGLRAILLEDPRAREISTMVNRELPRALLDQIAQRPDVAFLAPRTRALSATILLEATANEGRPLRAELLASGPADPLLGGVGPDAAARIWLTPALAERLGLAPGQALTGLAGRIREGERETLRLPLTLAGIAPASAFARDGVFASLPLLITIEDFLDGGLPATADPGDAAQAERPLAGFRLHARRLEDVPALDAALRAQGLELASRAGEVESLLRLDANLAALFAILAGTGGAGYLVSLAIGLWAQVERRRKELAMLSLLGTPRGALLAIPVVQAAATALAGAAIASGLALAIAAWLNRAFAGAVAGDRPVALLTPHWLALAAAATLLGALAAGFLAARRAAAADPADGLREG